MSFLDLLLENPSLATLTTRFPHLRRFLVQGFETDRLFHADNAVGITHPRTRQILRVDLATGDVCAL